MCKRSLDMSNVKKTENNDKLPDIWPQPKPVWRIAVLANIKDENIIRPADVPPDAYADYDQRQYLFYKTNRFQD